MRGKLPMTRWNLSIPEKTDQAIRTFLARTGGKKGDLSRFVDEAVRRMLDLTVQEIKDRNARHDQQKILDLIDEEVGRACGSFLIPTSSLAPLSPMVWSVPYAVNE